MRKIGCPHILVDNGDDPDYYLELCSLGVDAIRHETTGRPEKRLAESWEILRNTFLESGLEYMWLVEWDIYPRIDLIDELLVLRRPVIAVPYFTRGNSMCTQMYVNTVDRRGIINHTSVPQEMFVTEFPKIHTQTDVIPTGFGTGCLLINRKIAEHYRFKWIPSAPEVAPDTWLWYDFLDNNAMCFLYNTEVVEHRHKSWNEILN